jgi:hypothetical protein
MNRPFSHPNFGREASVEQYGREVRLVFTANTEAQASDLVDTMVDQLSNGAIHLTMMGRPIKVTEE